MIAQRYVALLDLLALASLPTALSLAQRYVALLDLLALASLPAAFSAPALLGPLDHDFLSTIIPVVAATGPEVGNLLNIAHRYGGVVLEPRDDADPAETWVDDPKFSALALNATKPAGYDIIYQNLHADWSANLIAKKRGARIPENQLINLALPWACSLLGALLFGISAQYKEDYHWIVFLLALGFMAFGFLGTSTITTVYVLECYPHIAGPALVNVASFRFIMAFLLTLWASDWILDLGYERTFLIYTGLVAGLGLFIPVVYYFGPSWRRMFPATRMAARSHD